ncbi:RNA polymerase subunit sigma-70 [Methylobacterium currus]|uniref:RNA polymerase subunit sigma-70 n=1 Tax=Methylobacterium currus TaxID=2051553 RepID=A0A2R4WE51_9HYPH|nr:RNA polymerase subunit sigma-70 [Methylobacterium currus]AWB19820.1 RNA polymerase subunit sigma-70 [Methylobacterium currus]UHC15461.1 RNA polymerase subunit sigma-70 [Methylobacterium currus]
MATLKEFEEALRENGMQMALAILERLRERDRANRVVKPGRRIVGKKMTPELAREILELHGSTEMTQQEIAFKLGVNQGRVNEVIKRGKWLSGDQTAPEAVARDKGKARIQGVEPNRPRKAAARGAAKGGARSSAKAGGKAGGKAATAKAGKSQKSPAAAQLAFGDL